MSSFKLIETLTLPEGVGNMNALSSSNCFVPQDNSTYEWYQIMVIGIQPNEDNATLAMQYYFNENGKPDDGNDYEVAGYCNDSGLSLFWKNTGQTHIPLFDNQRFSGAHSSTEVNATIHVYQPSSRNVQKSIDFNCNAPVGFKDNMIISGGAGSFKNNKAPITGINFFFVDSQGKRGNIDVSGGRIKIYGVE